MAAADPPNFLAQILQLSASQIIQRALTSRLAPCQRDFGLVTHPWLWFG
jgi:hypothetical protein